MITKILSFLSKPFKGNLNFLLALWVLVSAADLFYNCSYGMCTFGVYMCLHGLIQCYFITLVLSISDRPIWKSVFSTVFLSLGIVNLIADVWSHHSLKFGFTDELVAILIGTNLSECQNFVQAFFDWKPMAVIAIFVALSILIHRILKDRNYPDILAYLMLTVVISSISLTTFRHSRNWDGVFLNKVGLFARYEKIANLEDYRTEPNIQLTGEQPQTIVCIIGESLTKSQCQLYGYKRKTQPLLYKQINDLILFSDAHSPSQYTSEVFKSLLTTWTPQSSEDWYKSTYLFDILKSAGYKSWWISNQNRGGAYDNLQASFSTLCDTVVWTGDSHYGLGRRDMDEVVIPTLKQTLAENTYEKKFILLNIMGSHEAFFERYPKSFSKFDQSSYMEYLPEQRPTVSSYDNSVLYNDFVISECLNLVKDKEACVIYLSDHAIDLYVSDPSFAGHGRTASDLSFEVSTNIPMFAYCTESFRTHFPDKVDYLTSIKDFRYTSDNLPFTIMELCNISLDN